MMLAIIVGVGLLFGRGLVVVDVEVPPHRLVFRRERMEGGNAIVLVFRIAARLEHEHRKAGLGEASRHGAAACAGADDDVVDFRRRAGRALPRSEPPRPTGGR